MTGTKTAIIGALLLLAAVLLAAAYFVWMISDAHGHGLGKTDRNAIVGLGVAAGGILIWLVWYAVRAFRTN